MVYSNKTRTDPSTVLTSCDACRSVVYRFLSSTRNIILLAVLLLLFSSLSMLGDSRYSMMIVEPPIQQQISEVSQQITTMEPATLSIENVFFSMEGDDRTLQRFAADAMCSTWLRHVPVANARIYSDTALNLSGSCRDIGHSHSYPCCPGNETLGNSIQTAQYKREHLHFALNELELLPDIRWIVSTEQDAWWNIEVLLKYLRHLEQCHDNIHDSPVITHYKFGPFFILNRAMLHKVLGNRTFMNKCRHTFLEKNKIGSSTTVKTGALYNNDHLVRACIDQCRYRTKTCKAFEWGACSSSDQQAAFVYTWNKQLDFSNAVSAVPQPIASMHHVKSLADMKTLEERAARRTFPDNDTSEACLVWVAGQEAPSWLQQETQSNCTTNARHG